MADLNQNLYQASMEALAQHSIPEPLADAASRIIATDDANLPNLGRNDADIQVCHAIADLVNHGNLAMEKYNADNSPNPYDLEPEERK